MPLWPEADSVALTVPGEMNHHHYTMALASLRALKELASLLRRVAYMMDVEVTSLERALVRHVPMEDEEEERIVIIH